MITIENLKRLADNVKEKFVSIKQGKENYGKILAVNEDGNIETMSAPESMDVSYNEEEKRLVVSSKTNLPGNVSVDPTLSVSGNAADAKAVGNAVSGVIKYNEAQELTDEERAQARANIDAQGFNWHECNPGYEYTNYVANVGTTDMVTDWDNIVSVESLTATSTNALDSMVSNLRNICSQLTVHNLPLIVSQFASNFKALYQSGYVKNTGKLAICSYDDKAHEYSTKILYIYYNNSKDSISIKDQLDTNRSIVIQTDNTVSYNSFPTYKDSTLSMEGVAADAKAVGDRFNQLSEEIDNLQTSGLTTAHVTALDGMFKKCAYAENASTEYEAFKSAFGLTDNEETEATLSSISATYSGGSVLVGTSVNNLTGIVVTAKYSDGSTKTVTDYTLSGTIAEGNNIVTVSYGGKSTTITVIGYVEEEPEITLTSISATYTGGEVAVGTALTDLTGITVKATYSDGTTSNVTGYTLSGTIAEGSNTITVSYGGKTTTFTVTGVAESGGGDVVPLYRFEDVENAEFVSAYNKYPGALTVSNGNHVKATGSATTEWYWNFNVSSSATNPVQGTTPSATWFTIPAGASVKLCSKNITKTNVMTIRVKLIDTAGTAYGQYHPVASINAITEEFTFVAENDIDVSYYDASLQLHDSKQPGEVEFDVELYVNEVRWI